MAQVMKKKNSEPRVMIDYKDTESKLLKWDQSFIVCINSSH